MLSLFCLSCCCLFTQSLSIGPEIYHVQREREGGTQQDGWVYGVRGTYDRIKPWGFYWGLNGLYAQGPLDGASPSIDNLHSTFTDKIAEGRFGYTLAIDSFRQPSWTPYIGLGYLNETNNICHPSPTNVQFDIRFPYFAFGFLTNVWLTSRLSFGFNAKGYAMYDAQCQVQDAEGEKFTMGITDQINYRLELPIMYQTDLLNQHFKVGVVPFFEHRHYGGRLNWPHDFLDTRLNLIGVNLQLIYAF